MSHDLHIACPSHQPERGLEVQRCSLGHRQRDAGGPGSAGGRGGRDAAGLRDGGHRRRRLHLTDVSDEAQTETHRRPQQADDPLHLQTQHTVIPAALTFTSLHLQPYGQSPDFHSQ